MTTFIMAHGSGDRWKPQVSVRLRNAPPPYKQWLPIGGEPLICRTARHVLEAGERAEDVVVVAPSDFAPVLAEYGPRVYEIMPSSIGAMGPYSEVRHSTQMRPAPTLLGGILDVLAGFNDGSRACFLLGDVAFSRVTLLMLLRPSTHTEEEEEFIHLYGRLGPNLVTGKENQEWFGVRGRPALLKRAIGRSVAWGAGKLQDIYAAGLPEVRATAFYRPDYTDDTDTIEEYDRFWPALAQAALAEG